ncbi:hydantoinase/carbamoylase family amidase [Hoeflea sp.]|uniref:hydantoinase/carbamoylase family amidase n=1 Tax=Hoeflea sp. TaxID=1940281 RepID=UPI003BB0F3C7
MRRTDDDPGNSNWRQRVPPPGASREGAAPSIDAARLLGRLATFAAIGATAGGGVNRPALGEGDRRARALLAELARMRGFSVSQDAAANLFIRRPGRLETAPPFLIGSHLDSQPTGGCFDGALGVLAAFEVLETLEDANIDTDLPVEVVAWTNEEGSRFAPGSMGSRAFAEAVLPSAAIVSTDGARLGDELAATLAALPGAAHRPLGMKISGYLELHIEQGPLLERSGIPIGVVGAVQGTRWLDVEINGRAAHAGTTPLEARCDPVAAAVRGLAGLFDTVMQNDSAARMTVGRITASPGSINAVPASATFTIDLRHPDAERLEALENEIRDTLSRVSLAGGCSLRIERILDMSPARFSEMMTAAIERAAHASNITTMPMVSGAFHDALFAGRIAPAAMIFVPCRDGVSHHESEHVEPEFCAVGAEILLHSTLEAIQALRGEWHKTDAGAAVIAP